MVFNEWAITDRGFMERPNKQAYLFFHNKTAPQPALLPSVRSLSRSESHKGRRWWQAVSFLRSQRGQEAQPPGWSDV